MGVEKAPAVHGEGEFAKMERKALEGREIVRRRFYVYGIDGGRIPIFEHSSYASAEAEARRLAQRNPNCRFAVLYSTLVVRARVSEVEQLVSVEPSFFQRHPDLSEGDIVRPSASDAAKDAANEHAAHAPNATVKRPTCGCHALD